MEVVNRSPLGPLPRVQAREGLCVQRHGCGFGAVLKSRGSHFFHSDICVARTRARAPAQLPVQLQLPAASVADDFDGRHSGCRQRSWEADPSPGGARATCATHGLVLARALRRRACLRRRNGLGEHAPPSASAPHSLTASPAHAYHDALHDRPRQWGSATAQSVPRPRYMPIANETTQRGLAAAARTLPWPDDGLRRGTH